MIGQPRPLLPAPLRWARVHDLPDFVFFDHSIHVAKGVKRDKQQRAHTKDNPATFVGTGFAASGTRRFGGELSHRHQARIRTTLHDPAILAAAVLSASTALVAQDGLNTAERLDAFRRLDANGDGWLSSGEACRGARKLPARGRRPRRPAELHRIRNHRAQPLRPARTLPQSGSRMKASSAVLAALCSAPPSGQSIL